MGSMGSMWWLQLVLVERLACMSCGLSNYRSASRAQQLWLHLLQCPACYEWLVRVVVRSMQRDVLCCILCCNMCFATCAAYSAATERHVLHTLLQHLLQALCCNISRVLGGSAATSTACTLLQHLLHLLCCNIYCILYYQTGDNEGKPKTFALDHFAVTLCLSKRTTL